MFGLKERSYPAHVLISFWCDSENKHFDFFTFQNLSGYFSFVHFGYDQNFIIWLYTPARIISKYLLALGNLPGKFFRCFSAFSTKSKMAAKILCHSLELKLLYGFVSSLVQRNNHTFDVC